MAAWIALLMLIIASGALLLRGDGELIAGVDPADIAIIASVLGLLTFVGANLITTYRRHVGQAVRDGIAWSLLAVLVIGAYGYRDALVTLSHRAVSEFTGATSGPRSETQADSDRAVRIRRRPDGHFIARTEINGTQMPMLIDTGASTVVLRVTDAQKLGIDTDRLRYTVPVQTANGTTYAATVRLRRIAVGTITFTDVEALVAKPGVLKDSLLGMSFLNKLRSFEFAGEFLTLRI
jgi:aspartyl protease family protein